MRIQENVAGVFCAGMRVTMLNQSITKVATTSTPLLDDAVGAEPKAGTTCWIC
jgi:hypothetical protein